MIAFQNAPEEVFENGKKSLIRNLPNIIFDFDDDQPEIIFFLTGGSEKAAVNAIKGQKNIILLTHKKSNSNAAATEVKALLNKNGYPSLIVDIENKEAHNEISLFLHNDMENKPCRLGIIGKPSEWLIASTTRASVLKKRLNIELISIPWESLPSFETYNMSQELIEHFNESDLNISPTSRVFTILKETIINNELDAITVECFYLVNKYNVTACLPLSLLNDKGIPAACEGDIASAAGMIFVKKITGIIPWMANTVMVSEEKSLFAHCTVPLSLISNHQITTHFETGIGTAIQGDFKETTVTLFRLDEDLERAFVTKATIKNTPQHNWACRTQIEIQLAKTDIAKLKNNPLGNHHLIIPGDHEKELTTALLSRHFEII